MKFEQLVQERRSASNFLDDVTITENQLNEIFNLVKLGPSAFNLQHTKYMVVLNTDLKEKIKEAAYGQHKVSTASAVILVLGDKEAYKNAEKIYEGLLMLGMVNKQEYECMVEDTMNFYTSRGESFQRDEAIRNASLSAMLFMMAAKEKGWDTCPMIGFDADEVKEILQLDQNDEPVLMITIGKEKVSSRKPRGYRKPIGEFVTYL